MKFYEKKTKEGFNYLNQDIYGIIELDSEEKLDGKQLDQLVAVILQMSQPHGSINNVRFTYKATGEWGED